jgi:ubiquinone/menaquinone biosynthesis C-methylase UbiE
MGDRNHRETSLGGDWLRRLPHYLYVADLIAGKQVIEIGCGSGEGARFLADHGAARVVGVDARSGKVEQARRRYSAANLTFRHEDPASMELRDHSFDCVFVPDGASAARRPALLRELRRILAPGGHLILVSASADRDPEAPGLTFHEIKDALEPLFAPVRMVAQTPMVAMSLVEYAEEESDNVALDTSLVEWTRAPDGVVIDYMAICGGSTDVARGFTLVQLPLGPGVHVVERSLGGNGHVAGIGSETEAGGVNGGAVAGWSAGAGTVSAQIASALQEHAEMTRELERALAEQQLYSDELREELEQSLERSDDAERARKSLTEKLEAIQEELKSWRSRAAHAEGEVMRLRLARGDAPVSGVDGADPAAAASAYEREMATVRAELTDARQRLERVAVHWKEAEARAETLARRVSELEGEAGRQSAQADTRLAEARQQFDSELAQAVGQAEARARARFEEDTRARQAAVESELAQVRSELEQLRPELERLRAALAESEQRSEALNAGLDRLGPELARLRPELERLKAERDAQAQRADAAEAARAELERRLEAAPAPAPDAPDPEAPAAPKRKPRPRKKAAKKVAASAAELPLSGLEATADEASEPETPAHDEDA